MPNSLASSSPASSAAVPPVPVASGFQRWQVVILGAAAAGMGWGIRGQYGHETGAMIAGVLFALTLVLIMCPRWPALPAVRAVALGTLAIGFGGSETYGQTIGLTHDAPLVGHWGAWAWGMFGLAIKGSVWIGFAGAFLGLGLSGNRYRPGEMVLIFAGMLALMAVGVWLWNEPFDPAQRILPKWYFSDDWRWEPGADLKPRRERWGGLLLALLGLIGYLGWVRGDRLARRLAGWGMLGGALGFPAGQCLQSFHAWNRELFSTGWLARVDPVINWWNMMETTFGVVWGATLAWALWRNRDLIQLVAPGDAASGRNGSALPGGEVRERGLGLTVEFALLAVYVGLLVCWEFLDIGFLNALAEPGISMGLLPAAAVLAGRWWPYAVALPLTVLPIAGKSLRRLAYEESYVAPFAGWIWLVAVPLVIAVGVAIWAFRAARATEGRGCAAGQILPVMLLANGWSFFSLNAAFFHLPWPWLPWTARTPNALIYLVCTLALTWLALRSWRATGNGVQGSGSSR